MTQPIIRFEGVSKAFGTQTVLRDFSLDVEPGAFVSIIGRSGCGKTTVLKLVNGPNDDARDKPHWHRMERGDYLWIYATIRSWWGNFWIIPPPGPSFKSGSGNISATPWWPPPAP